MKNLKDISELKEFKSLEFLAKQVVEGFITGLHKSPFHGFSVEFAEHRLYNKGESVKDIDWKLYGRTEKFFVKRYEEETNLRCRIVIDTSSSMLFPYKDKIKQSKLAFSIFSAAAIINMQNKQRDAAGLTFFSDNISLHTKAKTSPKHTRYLFSELENLFLSENQNLDVKTKPSELLHEIADKIHKRSLVILFSDMFTNDNDEDVFSALQHLKHNKHEVILFHVIDKKFEEEFTFQNRPYKFVDMETGKTLKLNPNEVKQTFEQSAKKFNNDLKIKCGQYKIDFVEADINSDFKEVLIPYFLKRRKLY